MNSNSLISTQKLFLFVQGINSIIKKKELKKETHLKFYQPWWTFGGILLFILLDCEYCLSVFVHERDRHTHRRREIERLIIYIALEPVFNCECSSVIPPSLNKRLPLWKSSIILLSYIYWTVFKILVFSFSLFMLLLWLYSKKIKSSESNYSTKVWVLWIKRQGMWVENLYRIFWKTIQPHYNQWNSN